MGESGGQSAIDPENSRMLVFLHVTSAGLTRGLALNERGDGGSNSLPRPSLPCSFPFREQKVSATLKALPRTRRESESRDSVSNATHWSQCSQQKRRPSCTKYFHLRCPSGKSTRTRNYIFGLSGQWEGQTSTSALSTSASSLFLSLSIFTF